MIAELLERSGADQVELVRERQELLRFGASRLTYQHSEERVIFRARRGNRHVTLGSLDADAARDHLAGARTGRPEPAPQGRRPTVQTAFASTEEATAAGRVERFRAALAALPAGATLGGSIGHTIADHAVAGTNGALCEERRTRALVQLVAAQDGRSSYARALHRDAAQLADLARVADGLAPLPVRALEPGRYRALLGPQAVAVLAATLGQIAFHPVDGAFAARLGERVLGENVTLVDDGADPDGLPATFDCAGTPKQRIVLVERGVAAGVVRRETGHAVPHAWRFGAGPSPNHLFLAPGELADDDLARACDRGLSIQRVDYVRVVHPKHTVVTGSSRDATLWLEDGRAVARLPQFRFTLRLDELFSSLAALGAHRERAETAFMESVVAPAAVATSFPVDVVT